MNAPSELGKVLGSLPSAANQPQRKHQPDPYLTWADLTQYRYVQPNADGLILLAGLLREPGSQLQGLTGSQFTTRSILDTPYFVAQTTRPSKQDLATLAQYADLVLAEPGMQPIVPPREKARNRWHDSPRGRHRAPGKTHGAPVVFGVIDGLCAFANARFCNGHNSALDFLWDQGTELGAANVSGWTQPADLPYGRELGPKALNRVAKDLSKLPIPARVRAEQALYRDMGHPCPEDADWSHGTHILDTVLRGSSSDPVLQSNGRPGVVYVQLPELALRDTSGRWMAAHVLDAIDYIVTRAGADARHIIINLSLGSFAGPHDGSSLVERAIDEVVENSRGRLTVVVAAGNAGRVLDDGTGVLKACHARVVLEPANRPGYRKLESAELVWDIDVPDDTDSFMEIWVPDADPSGVSVSLRHETLGHDTGAVEPGDIQTLPKGGSVFAAVINATGLCSVPNGEGGMVLVALGHTSSRGSTPAPTGRWLVKISNRGSRPLTFDAWIERRDVPGELAGFRPQYGFGKGTPGLTSEGSLGTLANGRNTIVVGAAEWEPDRKTYLRSGYSSADNSPGAGNCNVRAVCRRGPDLYGEGKQVAAGYFSGTEKGLAGTSVAAAQVSAALAQAAPSGSAADALDVLYKVAIQRQRKAQRESEPRLAPELEDERRAVFVLPGVPREAAEQRLKEAKRVSGPRPAPKYEDERRAELEQPSAYSTRADGPVLVADRRVVASRGTGTPRRGRVTSAPATGRTP